MDIFELLDKLEDLSVSEKPRCPDIYIRIGNMMVPLQDVRYYPESNINSERIILGDKENSRFLL